MCSYSNFTSNDTQIDEIEMIQRVAYAYISPVIITFGVVGDLLTMLILLQPPLRHASVIYLYLSFLAVTDLCTLISLVPMLMWIMNIRSCSYFAAVYYAHIGFPLVNAFMGASVWIIVFFTLSQFMAVCYPFKFTFRRRRVCVYLTLAGYLLSFGWNIPWAFKYHVITNEYDKNCPYVSCEDRELLSTTWYIAYQWIREIINRLLPFCLIFYFNMRIVHTYRKSKKGGMRLPRVASMHTNKTQTEIRRNRRSDAMNMRGRKEEQRLLLLLMGIILVFFICTIPAAPLTILVKEEWAKNFKFQLFRAVTNTLEFTKFALNFYLYCMVNPDLRRLTILKLTCQPDKKRAMIGNQTSAATTGLNRTNSTHNSNKTKSTVQRTNKQTKFILPSPVTMRNTITNFNAKNATNTEEYDFCIKILRKDGGRLRRAKSDVSNFSQTNSPVGNTRNNYSLVLLHRETDTLL